jgi:uncharacterized protein YkwD
MGRWRTAALLVALAGCSEKSSVGDPCGGESFWIPGGGGETDPTNGHTRTYGNGHSLNWLETDQAVIDRETALIDLINEHRKGLGLDPLQFDQLLARCARGHSRHHFEDAFFEGHINPEGHSFPERMVMNGIDIESSGENVAYHVFLAQDVFQQWLGNATDRENIERMCFVRIGVGLHQDVWTANFAR